MKMRFETNRKYRTWAIGDRNCEWEYEVVSRTAKTVRLKGDDGVKSFKIKEQDGAETVMPLGIYAKAPILRAVNLV